MSTTHKFPSLVLETLVLSQQRSRGAHQVAFITGMGDLVMFLLHVFFERGLGCVGRVTRVFHQLVFLLPVRFQPVRCFGLVRALSRKFLSCSHCQEYGQLADLASDWMFTNVQPFRRQLAC